jgi:hypothetical protein
VTDLGLPSGGLLARGIGHASQESRYPRGVGCVNL